MDATFLQAALMEPPRICGVQLRPLGPGHLLLLDALGSRFLGNTGECTRGDLGLLLAVCSRPYAGARKLINERDRSLAMLRMGWRMRRHLRNPERFSGVVTAAERYLARYMEVPLMLDTGGSSEAPGPFAVVCGIVACSGGAVSYAEAWDMPYNLLVCKLLTHSDLRGGKALVSGKRREQILKLRSDPTGGICRKPESELTERDRRMQARLDARRAQRFGSAASGRERR